MNQGGRKRTKPVNFPENLIYDILSRLPTKSLIRFMCVSKTWNTTFIQDPYLIQLRQNLKTPNNILFLVVCHKVDFSDRNTKFEPGIFVGHIPTHEDQHPLEINNSTHILSMPKVSDFDVQSVNGLVCTYPKLYNPNIAIHICNPTTRQIVTLPHDNNLDFLYPKFHILTNFGYDPLEDKYKVLNVIFNRDVNETYSFQDLRILTIGDYVWRNVALAHDIPFGDLMSNIVKGHRRRIGTCVNGAIHWLDSNRKVIIVFDLRIEQFREIPIVEEFHIKIHLTFLALFNGYLSLVSQSFEDHIDMSILKDYENHVWIDHERILLNEEEEYSCPKLLPLCKTHTQQEIILVSNLVRDHQLLKVYYYDIKRRSSRRIFAVKAPSCYYDVGEREFLDWSIEDSRSLFLYHENFKQL